MCDTCEAAKLLLNDVSSSPFPVIDAFGLAVTKYLPQNQYSSFTAYHMLIGSTPEPYHVDLDVPAIMSFIGNFRAEYLQEV
jgi:hypothetical protein